MVASYTKERGEGFSSHGMRDERGRRRHLQHPSFCDGAPHTNYPQDRNDTTDFDAAKMRFSKGGPTRTEIDVIYATYIEGIKNIFCPVGFIRETDRVYSFVFHV